MMAALLVAAAVGGTPVEPALAAADAVPVAIFAYRDGSERPTAWPMTPYRDGDAITVTSTLAFMRKTEAVRRDDLPAAVERHAYSIDAKPRTIVLLHR